MVQFESALRTGADVSAVFVTEDESGFFEGVAALAHVHSGLPVILFRTTNRGIREKQFDLVVPSLVLPKEWLEIFGNLMARGCRDDGEGQPEGPGNPLPDSAAGSDGDASPKAEEEASDGSKQARRLPAADKPSAPRKDERRA
jgi:hypothetical protein